MVNHRTDFSKALFAELERHSRESPSKNVDVLRFPEARTASRKFRTLAARVLARFGLRPIPYSLWETLQWALRNETSLDAFHHQLDSRSRAILLELIAYRALGPAYVKLSRNDPPYAEAVSSLSRFVKRANSHHVPGLGRLNLYDLTPVGHDLEFYGHPLHVLNTFLVRQYELSRSDFRIAAREGDIVIDGGACWGDTSLYFAECVGPTGKVIAYEFDKTNLELLKENLNRNAKITNIEVRERALWSDPGLTLGFSGSGPSTRLSVQSTTPVSSKSVLTESIDALVADGGVSRVDFIKMDIEGAEIEALKGATETIRRFGPVLAISAYHHADDLFLIAETILQIAPDYALFLDHYTIHAEETLVFAVPLSRIPPMAKG